MIENSILKKNRQGLKALVLSLTFPSTEAIELAARIGFDAVNLDGEHGSFNPNEVELITRVAHGYGMSVTARVTSGKTSRPILVKLNSIDCAVVAASSLIPVLF